MCPVYVYRCPDGHEVELLRQRSAEAVSCGCGAQAQRREVYSIATIGRAVIPRDERSYRKAYGEYREAVEEVADGYERVNRDRAPEEQVRELDYFGLAKAQAKAKGAPIRD